MTYLKKINSDWNPQEHPGVLVGEVVDFPGNVQRLIQEGSAVLCDEYGNEVSAYDTLGVVTDRELEEFKAYKKKQAQEALGKSLEAEHDELLAQAAALKQTKEEPAQDVRAELEQKKKELAERLKKGREAAAAKKKAAQATA